MYSALYQLLYSTLETLLNIPFWLFGSHVPHWLVFIHVSLILGGVCMMGFITVLALFSVWAERKVSAYMQARLGPMEVGKYHGWLQTAADAIKLLLKEDIVPAGSDKFLFLAAPVLVFSGSMISYVVIPFGPHLKIADLDLGVFYILATSALVVVGVIAAGWSSYNKWSIYGGMRAASQYISYEIPTALHLLPAVLMAGSLNMSQIADSQAYYLGDPSQPFYKDFSILNWAVWPWINPFATVSFILYFIASLAETQRTPFDLAESESELVAGSHTEYSGIRWSFFFLAEYADMFVVSALGTVLFLGGWHGLPLIPPVLEFLLKALFLMFVMMWLRWTLPRLRVDQLTYVCWKVLLPFGFVTILGSGLWQLYLVRTPAGWVAGTVLMAVLLLAMSRIWKSEPVPRDGEMTAAAASA
ncbi:MAG: NADH-quinone oxidoreductase subunit H [Candidatus Hinthialibacteria bacterium OLB16]|nr:MAG: NADH-quinone oxidoreductase subunit H [Candidatus Hinthialibacteria bacterium OLB16]MBK7494046.1 NADH-quinone oxidoreductase subunit NuoH [Candidatus Omnitrophota bacterium]